MAFWHTFKLMAPQFVKPYVKMIKEEYLSGPIFADRLRFVTPANMTWRISMQSAITKGSTTQLLRPSLSLRYFVVRFNGASAFGGMLKLLLPRSGLNVTVPFVGHYAIAQAIEG